MRIFTILLVVLTFTACKKTATTTTKKIPSNHPVLNTFKTLTFPSKDGLLISADSYAVENSKGFILLCHQAGFSRGEYITTAKRLNKMGYSCLAIDQRSGKFVKNIDNETAKRANEKKLAITYLDAKPDIEAAIDYAYKLNGNKDIILVGSSYSASISLLLGTTNNKVKAIAAFSPGEYLKGINLAESIKNLNKPTFVTSSKKEIGQIVNVIKNVTSKKITHFKPEVESIHGSRALWESTEGNGACWKSFGDFLKSFD